MASRVKHKIEALSIAKIPLTISISGKSDSPLKISVKTQDTSFIVFSHVNLVEKNEKSVSKCLTVDFLLERLKPVNNTEYYIKHLDIKNLQKDLFISFKEISLIRKRILFILNGSKEMIEPIDVPFLKKPNRLKQKPVLSVFISSKRELSFCNKDRTDIFFQLPSCFNNEYSEFIDLFLSNKDLIPWFPSVLIGDDHTAAIEFLNQVQPRRIVTNNTGIAYEAYKKKIPWIAGPYLNISNSFSLLCLKEKFNCYGSFISNELSKYQIKSIISPEDFKLYYSIYHPILLLTSRQCLLHQVIGCEKKRMNQDCIQNCNKSSSITNLKKVSLFIEKTTGNYHSIYNNNNFLNTDIVTDFPDIFSSFMIDLRQIKTQTKMGMDRSGIIYLFENLLKGDPDSKMELKQMIHPTTDIQYKKGI